MDKITSQQFFQAWTETVQGRKDYLLSIWQQPRAFTSYIKGDDDSIMKEVADKLNLLCYHGDYYSLDTVLYKKEDLVPDRPENNYWFRDIRVAFEHENNFRGGLYQEVSHLLITDCDLKVLVAYPNNDNEQVNELNYLRQIIEGNRKSKTISEEESFLIILGYENGFCWTGFVYKNDGWKEI